jgi:hypothetical protein
LRIVDSRFLDFGKPVPFRYQFSQLWCKMLLYCEAGARGNLKRRR